MRRIVVTLACLFLLVPILSRADDAPEFELRDGDRVVFVGNTFIERDQVYGYLETMLTARWPDRNITFRNLGWSGDTVWGEARAGFDTPIEGFKRLVEQVETAMPTVIFVGYGTNESFAGASGVAPFREGLVRLLEQLEKHKPRIVVLSPIPHERIVPPLPDPEERNANLKLYTDAMGEISSERGHAFVDIFGRGMQNMSEASFKPRSENGMHLSRDGYWHFASDVLFGLKVWSAHSSQRVGECDGVSLDSFLDVEVAGFVREAGSYRFDATFASLPVLPNFSAARFGRKDPERTANTESLRMFLVRGLPPGEYAFRVVGKPMDEHRFRAVVGAIHWLHPPPDLEARQSQELRQAIVQKNRLYFHRWRPQNETYLFGFRKHEQGNNAAEIPKFDPLVEELEAKIAKLRVPVKHSYELIRQP